MVIGFSTHQIRASNLRMVHILALFFCNLFNNFRLTFTFTFHHVYNALFLLWGLFLLFDDRHFFLQFIVAGWLGL